MALAEQVIRAVRESSRKQMSFKPGLESTERERERERERESRSLTEQVAVGSKSEVWQC